jgi:hypothetical protein
MVTLLLSDFSWSRSVLVAPSRRRGVPELEPDRGRGLLGGADPRTPHRRRIREPGRQAHSRPVVL